MAISIRAVGAPVYGIANLTPVIPTDQLTGDLMICLYGTKPYSDAPTIDQGWTDLGYATDGTVGAGPDVGSMQTRVFYKISTSDTEIDPIVTNATNNVSTAVIIVFQKGAGDTWITPVGAGGGDATAGTDFSVTASADVGHTTGDMVVAAASFRSDAATPTTARAVSITGCTLGTYVQSPTIDPKTASGGDMSMTCGYVPVNSGTSSAAPVMTATLGAAHTGSAYLVRLRVSALTAVGDTLQKIWNVSQAVPVTSQYIYHIRASVADTLQKIWNVRSAIGDTLQNIWHTRSLTTKSVQLVHNVLTSIGDTSQYIWNVLSSVTAVGDTFQLIWHIKTSIGDTIQEIWHIRFALGDTVQHLWNTKAIITKTNQYIYHIRQAVGNTSQAIYHIRSAIGDTAQAIWNVAISLGKTSQTIWHIRLALGDTLQNIWHTRYALGDTSQAIWHTRQAIAQTRQTIWNVLLLASDTLQGIWNVRGLASKTNEAFWHIRFAIADTTQFVWNVLTTTAIGDTAQFIWHIRQTLSKSTQSLWNVLGLAGAVGDTFEIIWNTKTFIGKARQFLWNALIRIGQFRFSTRALPSEIEIKTTKPPDLGRYG